MVPKCVIRGTRRDFHRFFNRGSIAERKGRARERIAAEGSDPPSQVLHNRHDLITHYVNVITNSGNLKQPGRDTILIETTTTTATVTTTTTATGVILALTGRPGVRSVLFRLFVCFLFVTRFYTGKCGKACARRIRTSTRAR